MNKYNNMKKIFDKVIFVLLFLWQLPQNLVALFMFIGLKDLKLISYDRYHYCFKAKNMKGGISLGSFSFVSPYNADKPAVVAHESVGHVKQSHILGPLYLLIIGLPSILWAALYKTLGYKNYYIFYTESWANKLAGIETCGHTLRFIQEKELD